MKCQEYICRYDEPQYNKTRVMGARKGFLDQWMGDLDHGDEVSLTFVETTAMGSGGLSTTLRELISRMENSILDLREVYLYDQKTASLM